MTYEEAIAMYPHDSVHIQVDGVVRPMTPAEYEAFIEKQVEYVPTTNAMGASITGVVVAGCFSVLVALIHTMRKENRKDHGEVQRSLGRIEQKIDGHTENHK
jgi:hypothetical protein